MSLRGFFTTLGMVPLAMMFGGRLMALGGVFMVLRRFVVGVLRHFRHPSFELRDSERFEGRRRSRGAEMQVRWTNQPVRGK
jgi:hypothetical protein